MKRFIWKILVCLDNNINHKIEKFAPTDWIGEHVHLAFCHWINVTLYEAWNIGD